MTRVTQNDLTDRILQSRGTVILLGGMDTGKTAFGLELAEAGRSRGLRVAFVDADIRQSTVGPPACVGLKYCDSVESVDRESISEADELAFVGSVLAEDDLLSLVSATFRMVSEARRAGSDLIILDTTSLISGPDAEALKYHKLDLIRPEHVLGFQRGEELGPILGIAQRFFSAEVAALKVPREQEERSVEERLADREERFARYFAEPLSRWRVKPTVFMPALGPEEDLSRLDGLLVGLQDGSGRCSGIGLLEYQAEGNVLRMVSSVGSGAKGLRLGSVCLTTEGRTIGRYGAHQLFGG